jgi:hypothetical protein
VYFIINTQISKSDFYATNKITAGTKKEPTSAKAKIYNPYEVTADGNQANLEKLKDV